MAKSPFYRITVVETGTDITEWISSLHYEDCLEEDDFVQLQIDRGTVEMIDGPELHTGNTLQFEYGLMSEERSGSRYAVIKSKSRSYSNPIKITIKAHDKGFYMKRQTSSEVYVNMTASQIVRKIGDLFNMEIDVEETTKVYPSIAQGNKTYFNFIKYLANKEGMTVTTEVPINFDEAINAQNAALAVRLGYKGGLDDLTNPVNINLAKKLGFKIVFPADPFLNENRQRAKELGFIVTKTATSRKGGFEFFIRGNTLSFKQRDLSKDSRRTFVVGDPDGKVLDFTVQEEERSKGDNTEISGSGINPETGETFTEVSNNESTKETSLGNDALNFDVNGVQKNTDATGRALRSGKNLYQPVKEDKKEVKQTASKKKADASMGGLTATLELEMYIAINAGDILTMAGVAKMDSGNWRVTKVVDKADSGGGKTTVSLDKNAAKRGTGKGTNGGNNNVTGGVNDSKGSLDGNKTSTINDYQFDEDGNQKNNFEKKTGQKI